MKTLIEELRELVSRYELSAHRGLQEVCSGVLDVCDKLDRHSKVEEPLAVLADRKGILRFQYDVYGDNTWSIYLNKDEENGHWTEKEFYSSTYAECEAKARAYLEGLDDKGVR